MSKNKSILLPGVLQIEAIKKNLRKNGGRGLYFFNCIIKISDFRTICDKQVESSHSSVRENAVLELCFLPGGKLNWHPVRIRDFEEGSCIDQINSFHEDSIGFLEISPDQTFSGDKNLFDFQRDQYEDDEEILVSFIVKTLFN